MLISRGADKRALDNQGWTPADWADFFTNLEVLELLAEDIAS